MVFFSTGTNSPAGWALSTSMVGAVLIEHSQVEMYGGRTYTVDRVKLPKPISIRHLSIGVLGGVQPDRLELITKGPDDGLASRILWVWPDMLPTFTLAREHVDNTPAMAAFGWLTKLQMGTDQFGNPEPLHVRLTLEAEDMIEAFGREMRIRGVDAVGLFAGALGKARGHVLRLSAVLQHLWWCAEGGAPPHEITVQAVRAAARLSGRVFPTDGRAWSTADARPSPPLSATQWSWCGTCARSACRASTLA